MLKNGIEHFTIGDIKYYVKESGSHFFDRSAMRFFDSRVERSVYNGPNGHYFITSEQFHGSQGSDARKWTVRQFGCNVSTCQCNKGETRACDIRTLGDFNTIHSLASARETAREHAKG
jgi:hypothetical protein